MSKKFTINECYIYQELGTHREPIYIQLEKGKRITLEKHIAQSGIIPTAVVDNSYNKRWNIGRGADFKVTPEKEWGEVNKAFVQDNMKKVKVTVIIEEL